MFKARQFRYSMASFFSQFLRGPIVVSEVAVS